MIAVNNGYKERSGYIEVEDDENKKKVKSDDNDSSFDRSERL